MPFNWTPELDERFHTSKKAIVDAIRNDVEIFDINRRTCLRPDWSKLGIGYYLSQKHCFCPSDLPDCCNNGWKVTLVGSRFLHGAEQRYAPIEGEALAVAWGLEQTKYFTQGCDNLLVVTDHKPLVKILGDRTLDEISNTRMFRLKQRVLPWKFVIAHMPGISNRAADAASRYPSQSHVDINLVQNLLTTEDHSEDALNKAIMHNAYELTNLSWDTISETTCSDPVLSVLCIREGFPPDSNSLEPSLHQFGNIKCIANIPEGDVIMFCDRVVLPSSLRSKALSILHSAHQGTSAMEARAKSLLFWPGINKDIKTKRDECDVCCKNAPSQPALPAQSNPDLPTTPFESIFADFFDASGCHYLIAGDRLSGWVEVFSSKHGSSKSGSVGLVSHLRSLFATFGVPETISSDRGPEFTASHTSDFFKAMGCETQNVFRILPPNPMEEQK